MSLHPNETLLDRMVRAVELVRERLLRATAPLEAAGVPYAVAGGNAVAAWVASIDPGATRNTPDVDLLIRRADFDTAAKALEAVGFVHRRADGIDVFIDGTNGRERDAVHIVPAVETLLPHYSEQSPDVSESVTLDQFRVLSLQALAKMKLTSFRIKDRMHLRDMLDVGLIDESWTAKLPAELAAKLQELIETPEG